MVQLHSGLVVRWSSCTVVQLHEGFSCTGFQLYGGSNKRGQVARGLSCKKAQLKGDCLFEDSSYTRVLSNLLYISMPTLQNLVLEFCRFTI